jgi:hypothetical protein
MIMPAIAYPEPKGPVFPGNHKTVPTTATTTFSTISAQIGHCEATREVEKRTELIGVSGALYDANVQAIKQILDGLIGDPDRLTESDRKW